MSDVAVVGGTAESRLVIRGLLRMHRHRVVYEGPGAEENPGNSPHPSAQILIADGALDPAWSQLIVGMRANTPSLRVVMITSQRITTDDPKARELGISAILPRPFTVAEFSTTIDRVAREGTPSPSSRLVSVPA